MKIVQLLFPEGKKRAFTMSYDDGIIQDRRLVSIMNEYGVKGTFNLNSGFLGLEEHEMLDGFDTDMTRITEQEVATLYQNHEVANHGLTHSKITDIGTEVVAYQVIEDRKKLESLTGTICKGYAYPYGCYDEASIHTLKGCGIVYARTVESTGNFNLPQDFMHWHPTCHHSDSRLMVLAKEFCETEKIFDYPRLFYVWGHSYEFAQRNNWNVIEELLGYVANYKEDIWFATNGEIYQYVTAFKHLTYTVDGTTVYNPTASTLWLLRDGKRYCIPAGKTISFNE